MLNIVIRIEQYITKAVIKMIIYRYLKNSFKDNEGIKFSIASSSYYYYQLKFKKFEMDIIEI